MDTDTFNYVYSCDLDINVQLKMLVFYYLGYYLATLK